ncbi:hypothetical protein FRB95_001229 [Tulasnella sp. JGI-2019a]|nr:hypothetical protein FRB95_001229 [Tulasnella sp. JGI-2019a]
MDQRFSVQLKDSTRGMHDFLSSTPGAATLLAGQMSKEAYALYLFGIWHLYDALEPALDLHSTHPVLAPVYNPTLLRRKESISSDIAYFLGCSSTSPSEWQQHPLYTESFLPIPAPIAAYVSHINALSQSPDPSLLLTHSYIR